MSIRKYSLLTVLIYLFAFFAPILAPDQSSSVTVTTVTYLTGALLMVFLYRQQTEKLSFEKKKAGMLPMILLGSGGIFLAIFLQTLMMRIEQHFGLPIQSQNTRNIIRLITAQPLFALAAMVGGPIMEEFVFRRAIVGFFDSFSRSWIGMIVSSILFALIHQDGHLLLYFVLGFFFCLLYRQTGRIATSVITHVGMNSLVVIVNLLLPFLT